MLNLAEFSKLTIKPLNLRWTVGLGVVLLLAAGTVALRLDPSSETNRELAPANSLVPSTVNALGRIEPQGEVVNVSAPSQSMGGSQVIELRVRKGDRVQAGQIIAVLDSRDRLQATLTEAQSQVEVDRSRLKDIKAGAERGEIAAAQAEVRSLEAQLTGERETQQAAIARFRAELQNTETELRRNQVLFQEGAIAASALDSRELAVDTAQERFNEAVAAADRTERTLNAQIEKARAILSQTAEVQLTDISTAQAEVEQTIAAVNRVQAELSQSYVRAPKAGRILTIQTQAGETIGSNGIVELAATDQMIVIAEVYESDISKVRPGQTAIITSPSNVFSQPLRGTVFQIGSQVGKRDVLDTDPTAATDARVVEVEIELDKAVSQQVASLVNLQVNVEISP